MPASSRVVLLLAVLCLAAAFVPARADVTPPLAVRWVQSLGAEPDNGFSPLVTDARVLVSHNGEAYCFDALTGERQWEAKVEDQLISTAPIAWKDTVIAGLNSGMLGCVKASDKSIVWQTNCGGTIAPSPLLLNDLLLLGAEQTALALFPDTGKTKWACTLTSPARYGPLTDGSTLFFRCQDGSLQSVDAVTGRFRWRVPVPFGPESFPPVMAGGRVIVTAGKTLHAIARTGAESWKADLPAGVGGPIAVVEDTMYVPCVDGRIYALFARSGRPQHGVEYKVDSSATATPLITENHVIVGTSNSLIYVLDRATGAVQWVYRCRAPEQAVNDAAVFGLYAPLVTADGALYALTGDGDLYCFTATAPDDASPEFTELTPPPGEGLSNDSLSISFAVYDDGCGIKPDSVTLTVDGNPLEVRFDAPSGVATAWFSQPEDGVHLVKATASDYRGNTASKEWSFLTDESLAPEEETDQTRVLGQPGATPGGTAGQPRGGARPGGGGGGGGRRGGGG
jgi:outer membrane protein assembly factor BamB